MTLHLPSCSIPRTSYEPRYLSNGKVIEDKSVKRQQSVHFTGDYCCFSTPWFCLCRQWRCGLAGQRAISAPVFHHPADCSCSARLSSQFLLGCLAFPLVLARVSSASVHAFCSVLPFCVALCFSHLRFLFFVSPPPKPFCVSFSCASIAQLVQ